MTGIIKIHLKGILLTIIIITIVIVLLAYSTFTASGVAEGLSYAAKYLIPSLFPFMVISSFTMYSGAYRTIGKLFSPFISRLFRLPKATSAAIILSFVGGFPIGAKCTAMLYSSGQINEKQANQMMTFCVSSGPAFLITAVGTIMLGNGFLGIILYISQLLAAVVTGIIVGIFFGDETDHCGEHSDSKGICHSLICSCSDAAYSVIELTALVVVFTIAVKITEQSKVNHIVLEWINALGANDRLTEMILPVFLEVTGACRKICSGGFQPWVLSLAVGFGGLCVHLQIFHILRNIKINKKIFFLFRLINSLFSSVITYVICIFYQPVSQTFAVSENTNAEPVSGTYIGAAALIVMCVVFLLSFKRSYYSYHNHISNQYFR